jgi:CBS domain-containing protein
MKVSECMTRDVRIVDPDETLQDAARAMADIDAGILPVGERDRLVGMITDRDIAIRGMGTGREPGARVREVMSDEVLYCFDDDDADDVLDNMGDNQVRRLPVLNHDKRLVGIVSITDLANGDGEAEHAGEALTLIASPSPRHSQSL